MSLSHGRVYRAMPGPSVSPERVLRAMHRTSPNIYYGELVEMVPGIVDDLKSVARTTGDLALYIANGHGAWEAAFANTLAAGDRALFIRTGAFTEGWCAIAEAQGISTEVLDFGMREGIDAARLSERLAQPDAREIRAICLVHADTASSVRSDVAAVRAAIDEAELDALFFLDCIASFACDGVRMDDWGVDILLAASQKGLMTPPGMALVYVSKKAREARLRLKRVPHYWDWDRRIDPEMFYQYFDGTAPTHHLYGLREALDIVAEEGLDAVHRRHAVLAQAVWAAAEHWGQDGPLELNVAEPSLRTHATTTIRVGSEKGTALRTWCDEKAGLLLGIGLGMAPPGSPEWHHAFRIGHMGHLNAHMVLGALGTIEAGLTAVGIEHRPGGVVAASDVVARFA